MNGKQAKRIRRFAEQQTTGKPQVVYQRHRGTGQITLHPECTRAVYQRTKRAIRREARHGR